MEANISDISNLDGDAILPPRKRLLAGFKKQNSDNDTSPTPPAVASSSPSASLPNPNSPSSSRHQSRLDNLLISRLNNNQNLSPEQIVLASKSAVDAALRAAGAARAAAQEKAVTAVQAMAAAKTALALVALFPPKERNLKKNKLKKHVQLQLLYKKHHRVENFGDGDEAVARKLPRKKKVKSSPTSNGSTTIRGEPSSMCNDRNSTAREFDEESSQMFVDAGSPSKRRGRLKLKKLPLSTFSSRDQANPKDESILRSVALTDKNMGEFSGCNHKSLHLLEQQNKVIPS